MHRVSKEGIQPISQTHLDGSGPFGRHELW